MHEIVPGLVSTIIPVYNRPQMLREAVASVLAQTYRPIEIIIADDGSTDGAGQVADELASAHPGVVLTVHNPNRGPGPAREAGRQLARGEFIQYLDSDDLLAPRKFEAQVQLLKGNPDCGIAYGITRLVDMRGNVLKEPFKLTGGTADSLFPGLLVDRWWCTHTPLYRRSLTDTIGAWSDLRYSQDWEYDGRAGALKTRLVNCGVYVSDHRTHGEMRQTGHGKWLAPKDRVRFFSSLLGSARKAGVPADGPEMRHFARWVFLNARQCGVLGDAAAAKGCFDVAVSALGAEPRDMRAFRWFAGCTGWCFAGRLSTWLNGALRRRPGKDTRTLSWAQG